MVGMYGLSRLLNDSYMKTLRIVNKDNRCVYVERRLLRCIWYRVSPRYRTNIEAYNWVRRCGDVNLITKKSKHDLELKV